MKAIAVALLVVTAWSCGGAPPPTGPDPNEGKRTQIAILWASKRVGRPVKWRDERSESFLSDSHGRGHDMEQEVAFDAEGRFLEGLTNDRVLSVRLEQRPARPVIGVAAGEAKIAAVKGALHGHLINGLISDEATAEHLLASA